MPSTSDPAQVAPASNAASKPAIVIHDVRKTFTIKHTSSFKEAFVATVQRKELSSQFNAVDGLSLDVPVGQSVALLGRNGSGKSTTLKLLSGVMRPDSGWIRTRGRIAGLLEVGAGFNPNLTGRDNVFLNAAILGMSKEETEARFDDILEFSEIGDFIDTEVKHYSSGMYSRLGFSVAVHTELDVLLVDEILSVGDAAFRAKCADRMQLLRQQGKTMFVVSHSASQVKELCERGVVLHRGKVVFDGPIDDAVDFIDPKSGMLGDGPLGYSVRGGIRTIYERNRRRLGQPVEDAIAVEENGGGWSQRFESGVITWSSRLSVGHEVFAGPVLDAYISSGGPSGEWGFVTSSGRKGESSQETVQHFQHGTARTAEGQSVTFTDD